MCNGKFTRRMNKLIRERFIFPKMRRSLKNTDFTLISNNCTAGFVLHDLGVQFQTPTINLYFPGLDYFKFLENFEEFLRQDLEENPDDAQECPCGILRCGTDEVRIRFAHYQSFEEAKKKWEERKQRIHMDNLFVVWTYMGISGDEELYARFERLPFKNKVAFLNKDISDRYPSHFYIKGFENHVGTGQLGEYSNLFGRRYYDQYNWVKWFNEG